MKTPEQSRRFDALLPGSRRHDALTATRVAECAWSKALRQNKSKIGLDPPTCRTNDHATMWATEPPRRRVVRFLLMIAFNRPLRNYAPEPTTHASRKASPAPLDSHNPLFFSLPFRILRPFIPLVPLPLFIYHRPSVPPSFAPILVNLPQFSLPLALPFSSSFILLCTPVSQASSARKCPRSQRPRNVSCWPEDLAGVH